MSIFFFSRQHPPHSDCPLYWVDLSRGVQRHADRTRSIGSQICRRRAYHYIDNWDMTSPRIIPISHISSLRYVSRILKNTLFSSFVCNNSSTIVCQPFLGAISQQNQSIFDKIIRNRSKRCIYIQKKLNTIVGWLEKEKKWCIKKESNTCFPSIYAQLLLPAILCHVR